MEYLKFLNCNGCTSLINIPEFKELKELDCKNCPYLTSIPYFKGLEEFNFDNGIQLVKKQDSN